MAYCLSDQAVVDTIAIYANDFLEDAHHTGKSYNGLYDALAMAQNVLWRVAEQKTFSRILKPTVNRLAEFYTRRAMALTQHTAIRAS
jgi:hypothetical protein